MEKSFEIWDVFTTQRFRGNPLAVFPDGSGLSTEQMSDIAREMAHSETTFVLSRPPEIEHDKGVRVRIFAKAGDEMPFAGHPTLGTAFALWTKQQTRTDPEGSSIILEENIGGVPVHFKPRAGGGWDGEMLQTDPVFAPGGFDAPSFARILGINAADIDANVPIESVSTGRVNILVMLRSLDAVRRVTVDWRGMPQGAGVYLLTREVEQRRPGGGARFHARKPTRTGDDPVTGSAGGCAAAWLVKHGLAKSGERVLIEQGSEVKRQGEMLISAVRPAGGGKITGVTVGGSAVLAARGSVVIS